MRRNLILALGLAASACAPAPVSMHATEASQLLAQFAAGAGPADVCTPNGRALLRGAVRAYGEEMKRSGVAWPAVPVRGEDPDELDTVEISVLIAFAAGFVQASDFHGATRGLMGQLTFTQWPEMRAMRAAARVACDEVVDLQQAASRYVMEADRYQRIADGSSRSSRAGERLQRQARLMERAREAMEISAAALQARVEAVAAQRAG